jgi:hypothetical protein
MPTSFRCYQSDDLSEVLRIQRANLIENLSPAQRRQGFLSVEFLPEQLEQINEEIPIIVADLGGSLGGYVFGTTLESSRRVPILAHMMELFTEVRFQDRHLYRFRSFMYGPICVDDSLRGTGILEGLFAELCRQITGRFDLGVSFVSRANPRSLEAHVRKLRMIEIAKFEFEDKPFHMLAFKVPDIG